MEELENLKKRYVSLIIKAENGGVCLLNFLDEMQEGMIKELLKNNNEVNAYFYGGIKNASKNRCIISSYDVENSDFKITIFKINYNKKFNELNHRNVLGSLMALGIKREVIGDIIIYDNKDIYFSCSSEIEEYIVRELTTINHAPISLEKVDYEVNNQINYETKTYFLASLRLDVVISAMFNLSRSEALDMIKNGLVIVNCVINMNVSYVLKENDEISVRHKGKMKVSTIGGKSRSGRIICELKRRV